MVESIDMVKCIYAILSTYSGCPLSDQIIHISQRLLRMQTNMIAARMLFTFLNGSD